MSDFGNREAHEKALDSIKQTVGEQAIGPHKGGYLSQDEYATKIYYWAGEEHTSDEIDGVIATLDNESWAKTPQRELPVAGTVLALCELYPDKAAGWRHVYKTLFQRVRHAQTKPKSLAAWNDFYIAQWFLLRRARRDNGVELIDKLMDRVAEGGTVRYDAIEAMRTLANQCKPFELAWQAAAKERQERMVVKVQ